VPIDAQRVAAASLSSVVGQGWRHLAPHHDPLSGEGARMHGGRFNPPGSFPVLYLCKSRSCAVAELQRLGERQVIGVEGLLPRVLYRYEVSLDRVLDLTIGQVRAEVGLSLDVLTGPDWTTCQELGVILHALGARLPAWARSSPCSSSGSASAILNPISSRSGIRSTRWRGEGWRPGRADHMGYPEFSPEMQWKTRAWTPPHLPKTGPSQRRTALKSRKPL
jgi:RES domain-containing protein